MIATDENEGGVVARPLEGAQGTVRSDDRGIAGTDHVEEVSRVHDQVRLFRRDRVEALLKGSQDVDLALVEPVRGRAAVGAKAKVGVAQVGNSQERSPPFGPRKFASAQTEAPRNVTRPPVWIEGPACNRVRVQG